MNLATRVGWAIASIAVCGMLAMPCRAAISEEGAVTISSSLADVGFPNQTTNEGTLRITPPSTLTVAALNVARAQRTVHGRVFIDGAAMTVTQNAVIGEIGQGSLEVSDGGLFDAAILLIGGGPSSAGNGAEGSVAVTGPGTKLVTRNRITVGEFGTGELRIADGALVQSSFQTAQTQAFIANGFGSQGTATVTGDDSAWEINGPLTVGGQGAGQLHILDGAHVTSLGAVLGGPTGELTGLGVAVIDGAGSRWTTESLVIGDRSTGELRIANGGVLDVSNSGRSPTVIGRQVGSFGRLIVSGSGTQWLDSQVTTIGQAGVGELIIEDGALVATGGAIIGGNAPSGGGLVRVSGPNTRWQPRSLTVGGSVGSSALEISDGATVAMGGGQLSITTAGRLTLNHGTLTGAIQGWTNRGLIEGEGLISGQLTNIANGHISVGPQQHLTIVGKLTNQGSIQAIGGELEITNGATNSGSIIAEDATLRTRSPINLLSNSGAVRFSRGSSRVFGKVFNVPSGSIAVTGGGQVTFYDDVANSSLISASAGTTVTVLGAMSGNGVQGDGTVFLEGPVSPGSSPGVMHFGADVHLGAASRLNIEVSGALPGVGFDQLSADGTAYLGGVLNLTAIGELGASATLPIVSAADLVGAFDSVPEIGTDLGFGVRFNGITYDYNQDEVRVSLVQGSPADLDGNGSVDGVDFLEWQAATGASVEPTGTGGDINRDGTVDEADLAVWAATGAATAAAQQAAQTTVPEPSAVSLLFVVGLGGFGVRARLGGLGR
jgi:T5SS/PEP-CTERM-associated repeat protein